MGKKESKGRFASLVPPSRIHQFPHPNKKVLINKKTFQLDAYCPPAFLFLPNCPTPGGRPSEGTWDQAARHQVWTDKHI